MCMEYSTRCECGSRAASFHFHENLMPPDVIRRLYCPVCSRDMSFDPGTMVKDNGWVIEYDMDIARFSSHKLPGPLMEKVSPETLFDEGYATWRGIYPGDHLDNARERTELAKLAKADPRGYLNKMKTWAVRRMERLREEGWRKANGD